MDEIQENDSVEVGDQEEEGMISHVVLFRPRASLTPDQRKSLIDALRRAVEGIAQIKRATIGKRLLLNRPGYETQMAEHYEYSAILEFDSEADLRAYLDHPAHNELGKLLFTSAEAGARVRFRRSAALYSDSLIGWPAAEGALDRSHQAWLVANVVELFEQLHRL